MEGIHMLSVNTNTGAMVALQNLTKTNADLATTQNRINTGLAVGGAKDNGAVYAIAQNMRGDVAGYSAVSKSLQRAGSTVDVAIAAGEAISDLLIEMKEKALSAADSSLDTASRSALNEDFKALRDQIASVVNNAAFNGFNLVNNSTTGITALASSDGTKKITVQDENLKLSSTIVTVKSTGSISTLAKASTMVATVTASLKNVDAALGRFAAGTKKFDIQMTFVQKLSDTLTAGIGNDYIDGYAGADVMRGNAGNDVYVVDNGGDSVNEAVGAGQDTVYARTNYALTAGSQIETLSAVDHSLSDPIALVGNEFANNIYGNAGANYLDGQGGADAMIGFGGNDIFIVDNGGDIAYEFAGQGSDTVYTSTSYTLTGASEIEVLSVNDHGATTAINLTGNGYGNVILGNSGANTLNGAGGADYLLGFGGADNFAFTSTLGGGNVDILGDFSAADDTIQLDDAVFTGLSAGGLSPGAFVIGTAALDADDRILYNQATGQLYFDADGNGAGAAVLFAQLQGAPVISASDFTVI